MWGWEVFAGMERQRSHFASSPLSAFRSPLPSPSRLCQCCCWGQCQPGSSRDSVRNSFRSPKAGPSWWWSARSSWALWSNATWCHWASRGSVQLCRTSHWDWRGHRHQTTTLKAVRQNLKLQVHSIFHFVVLGLADWEILVNSSLIVLVWYFYIFLFCSFVLFYSQECWRRHTCNHRIAKVMMSQCILISFSVCGVKARTWETNEVVFIFRHNCIFNLNLSKRP